MRAHEQCEPIRCRLSRCKQLHRTEFSTNTFMVPMKCDVEAEVLLHTVAVAVPEHTRVVPYIHTPVNKSTHGTGGKTVSAHRQDPDLCLFQVIPCGDDKCSCRCERPKQGVWQ